MHSRQCVRNRLKGVEMELRDAPLGTRAPAFNGGHWIKVERGWKWCTGSKFPRPGADWTGELILPGATSTTQPAGGAAVAKD